MSKHTDSVGTQVLHLIQSHGPGWVFTPSDFVAPAKVVFLTDGATRTIKVGPTQICLKRTTPRNMAGAGKLSGLLIQAFRSLGAAHITPQRIGRLRSSLPAQERALVLQDLALAPEWMHSLLREVAQP